jgi:Cu/Ag efflux protein CusF
MKMTTTLKMAVAAGLLLGATIALADEGGAMVNGEITKVDESAGKMTIKHEPIPNLGMEAMTMVFKAGEGVVVKDLKPGDKIKFHADMLNGQIAVTKVEKAQ